MSLTPLHSRLMTQAGLLGMLLILLLPAPSAFSGIVAIPLGVLFLAGFRPAPKWGGWAAAFMVPYFAVALGEVIADPENYQASSVFSFCAVCVFLAGLDHARRSGVSLRR